MQRATGKREKACFTGSFHSNMLMQFKHDCDGSVSARLWKADLRGLRVSKHAFKHKGNSFVLGVSLTDLFLRGNFHQLSALSTKEFFVMPRGLMDSLFYVCDEGIFDNYGICPDWDTLISIQRKLDEIFQEHTRETLATAIEEAIEDQRKIAQARKEQNRLLQCQQKKQPKPCKRGYVYLMRDSNLNCYKIGFSSNPSYREQTLQAQKPTIELLYTWKGSLQDEKQLHARFNDKRIRGEWFDLQATDIEEIRSIFESEANNA